MWHVYILQCRDKTFYTGITNDLAKRIRKHNEGTASKYTRPRRPVKLVYSQKIKNRSRALSREAEIKRMNREKKKEMVGRSSKEKRG